MKSRIEEVMSRILSRKHDAIITIKFKEIEDEQRSDNSRAIRNDKNAVKRDNKA
jgi:hypothetical protein